MFSSPMEEERVIPQLIPKGKENFQNWQRKLGLLSDSCGITNCSGETLQENNEEVNIGATWTGEHGLKRLINLQFQREQQKAPVIRHTHF